MKIQGQVSSWKGDNVVETARGARVFKNNAVSTSTLGNKFNNDNNNFAKK